MNLIEGWKLWGIFTTLETEAKKETTMGTTVTPGWKTSEFWLHIIAQLPSVLAVFLGASSPIVIAVAAAGGLASSVYTFSRSGLKSDALTAAASAAASAAADALAKATPPAPAP